MKLPQFTISTGDRISINPQHVVTVRPSDIDKQHKTSVFLVTGGQITVDGSYDEVMAKMSGEA